MNNALRFAALLFFPLAAIAADKPVSPDDVDPRNWPGFGRTDSEAHYSPLAEIQRDTVPRLRLAWSLDLQVNQNVSTPLAVDGVVYVASGYSIVHAVDAKTGKLLWRYDSDTLKAAGAKLRKGWGVRGLAYSQGRLFVGTHDGRLIALDAKKGGVVWTQQTLPANDTSFISGAPRVMNGKVFIGFGGAETLGVRGYVSAYDAATGKQLWRFYTVPEGASGGAVWNGITVDPQFNRVYVGVGNAPAGAPTDPPYLNSIVALDADTGAHVWHYQTTPNNLRGYDSANDITLATLDVGGPRPVLMQAPKNGGFYVIDRANGKLVSAQPVVTLNWKPGAPPSDEPQLPGVSGAHGPFPQSYSARTGLVYLPTIGLPFDPRADRDAPGEGGESHLVAWNPVKQRTAWQIPTPGPFNGGTLATGGDLVFQGQADGYINAYDATGGRKLWSFYAASAALGSPISFAIAKKQYIAILVGPPAGAAAAAGAPMAKFHWDYKAHPRRLLAFTLDGTASLPPTPSPTMVQPLDGTGLEIDDALVKEGQSTYGLCRSCHGAGAVAAGNAPDLRASAAVLDAAAFATVVKGGLETRGMPMFSELSDRQLDGLRQFIRAKARLVTRPTGEAPVVAAPAAPTNEPKKESEPDRPPGSLESTTPRQ